MKYPLCLDQKLLVSLLFVLPKCGAAYRECDRSWWTGEKLKFAWYWKNKYKGHWMCRLLLVCSSVFVNPLLQNFVNYGGKDLCYTPLRMTDHWRAGCNHCQGGRKGRDCTDKEAGRGITNSWSPFFLIFLFSKVLEAMMVTLPCLNAVLLNVRSLNGKFMAIMIWAWTKKLTLHFGRDWDEFVSALSTRLLHTLSTKEGREDELLECRDSMSIFRVIFNKFLAKTICR